MKKQVAEIDKRYFELLRKDVADFVSKYGKELDSQNSNVLDIAPQDHEGAKPYFPSSNVETLDIDPNSGASYVADICQNNENIIKSDSFDVIVCTEVLEHTLQPFDAVKELHRILKPGGVALVSTPYNFRIHGPLPDCWRFTEHGLRELFKEFEIVEIHELEDEERFLAPIHYTLYAKK
jgi:SAM-dependent methyltransferase